MTQRGSILIFLVPVLLLGAAALVLTHLYAAQSLYVVRAVQTERARFNASNQLLEGSFVRDTRMCIFEGSWELCKLSEDGAALDLRPLLRKNSPCGIIATTLPPLINGSGHLSARTCVGPELGTSPVSFDGNIVVDNTWTAGGSTVIALGQFRSTQELRVRANTIIVAGGGIAIADVIVDTGVTLTLITPGTIEIGEQSGAGKIVRHTEKDTLRKLLPIRAPYLWSLSDRGDTL